MNININADMGESFGPWPMGDDASLIQVINSANVACGFHAGDPVHMVTTVQRAPKNSVSIGAHPAFHDLQGFGRRPMKLSDTELSAVVTYQVGALQAIAAAQGGAVTHVKPHGAMSNMACADDAPGFGGHRGRACDRVRRPVLVHRAPIFPSQTFVCSDQYD